MGFHRGPKIVTDGLVFYVDAANPKSYPGTGTVWYDLSSNGNNATLVNGPIVSNGKVIYDGINDYSSASFTGLEKNGSRNFWFNLKELTLTPGIMFGAYNNFALYTNNNNGIDQLFQFIYYNKSTTGSSAAGNFSINNIVVDRWYNTVVTWDEFGTAKHYLDGVLIHNQTVSDFSTWKTNISMRIGGYVAPMEGSIVQMYNKPLSAEEVLENYNATKARFGL